ncbi:MAG TPA: zinc-dependent alcohol dehydrogenase family protein [Thermodesulfovibrionales bacterium]|nr:zinc-dependent alcohol dehydrogenase family protein [Thermodesulfovibrionales bacterium]
MKAMILERIADLQEESPLRMVDMDVPVPEDNEVLVRTTACGVCHTELDEIEGRTPPPILPVIPGHQIVGKIEETGRIAERFKIGDRVGIAWIFSACGKCSFCLDGRENLCSNFKATGRDANGGYAEYVIVHEDFAYPIPKVFQDTEAAPLLCAGAVGYRSLRLTGMRNGENVGLSGFGASAHLVMGMIKHRFPASRVFVFSRTETERDFARELGAIWTGDFEDEPPEKLHSVIDTTPSWAPVVKAMKHLEKGGRLIINAIMKEERDRPSLLALDYVRDIWMEREIKSVANITRRDVEEFLELAAKIPLRPKIEEFSLQDANVALREIKERKIRGAKVLKIL